MKKQYFIVQVKDKNVVHFQKIQKWEKQTASAAQDFNKRMISYGRKIQERREDKNNET